MRYLMLVSAFLIVALFAPDSQAGPPDNPVVTSHDVVDQMAPAAVQADIGPLASDAQAVDISACECDVMPISGDRAPGVLRLLRFADAATSSHCNIATPTVEGRLVFETGRCALGDRRPRQLC